MVAVVPAVQFTMLIAVFLAQISVQPPMSPTRDSLIVSPAMLVIEIVVRVIVPIFKIVVLGIVLAVLIAIAIAVIRLTVAGADRHRPAGLR